MVTKALFMVSKNDADLSFPFFSLIPINENLILKFSIHSLEFLLGNS